MKKFLSFIVVMSMILLVTGCSRPAQIEGGEGEVATQTQFNNPLNDFESIEKINQTLGFKTVVPENIEGYNPKSIQSISNEIAQVIYENDQDKIIIRKAAGNVSIDGDYNDYQRVNEVSVNKYSVTYKGDADLINVATWVSDGYSYAVTSDAGVDEGLMSSIIEKVS